MCSLDVGEGTGISGWDLYVYDSDFVQCPEYLGSFPHRGTLSRKLSGGRALGFLPLTTGPPLLQSAPLGQPRTDSGKSDERGMLRDAGVGATSDVQKRYASSLEQGRCS